MVRLDYTDGRGFLSQIMAQAKLKCDGCGYNARLEISENKHILRCFRWLCNLGRSLWKDTVFDSTRIPSERTLAILDLWVDGASTKLICKLVKVERKAVHRLLRKVSRIAVPRYYAQVGQGRSVGLMW
ncbi:hypothetical protein PAPHI01_2038 [Pancytospora philotis]|nr:hypothetical protein PAPHI01_2038 [Pancytospora philotis]